MNSCFKFWMQWTGALGISLVMSASALAETQEYKIDTLTVTAQKREENIQDVPMSMEVFSGETLEGSGITDMQDLVPLASNIFIKSNSAENIIVMRGVSSFKSAIYSPAGVYIDGVPAALAHMHNPALFDIERVEILKGPQGTLYGRNTESGLINLITRQPDDTVQGKLFAEYGIYDTAQDNSRLWRGGGSVSGPIIEDTLFLGLSFVGLDSNGFMTDIVTGDDEVADKEHLNGRSVLRWTPSDATDVSLIMGANRESDGFGVYRLATGANALGRNEIQSGDPGLGKDASGDYQTLRVKHQGPGWQLVSITSRQVYDTDFTSDMDFNGGPMYADFGYDDEQYSQEIRLSSDTEGTLTWLAGIYGYKEEVGTKLKVKADMMGNTMEFWNPVGDIDMEGYAFFAQATWSPVPRVHLTAGLRYDHQELDGRVVNTNTSMMKGALPGIQVFKDSLSYDEVLPKVAVSVDLTDDMITYVSVAKGYQIGGFNYSMVMSPDTFSFDPEYTWNYEVGVKSQWFDRRLTVNGALFYIDIRDKQIDVNNPDAKDVPMAPDINNAGEAHTYGAELDINAQPMRGLDLFAGLGLTETKIDNWIDQTKTGQVDYKGKKLVYAPDYTYNLGAQYRHHTGVFARAELSGTGKFYGDTANTVSQDPYELVNLRLGYEAESFDVVFWCKNLLDEEYFTVVDKIMATGDMNVVEGDPRLIGVTLTYRF